MDWYVITSNSGDQHSQMCEDRPRPLLVGRYQEECYRLVHCPEKKEQNSVSVLQSGNNKRYISMQMFI